VQNICEEKMTSMIEQACLAAWPDYETVTDEMRSRMRAAIAAMQEPTDAEHTISIVQALTAQEAAIIELQEENAALKAERDKLRVALETLLNVGIIDDEETRQARNAARRALEKTK
jgi:hypothetical protein